MPNQYNEWETERDRYGRRPEEQGRGGRGYQERGFEGRDFGERGYTGREYGERGYRGEGERFFSGEEYERRPEEERYGERRFGGEEYQTRERIYPRSYESRERLSPRSEEDYELRRSGYQPELEQTGGTRSWALSGRADERGSSRERAMFGERTSRSEGYGTQDWREGYPGQQWKEEPGAFGREYGTRERESWAVPGPYVGRGPQGYKRSDERIMEDVNERLTQHGQLDAFQINVQVKDGEVTLSGTVNNRQAKRLAEDIAESCSGVKEVQNQLRVKQETAQPGQATGQPTQTEQKRSAAKQ